MLLKRTFVICFVLIWTFQIKSQEIVTVDFLSNISRLTGSLLAASQGIDVSLESGADLFRVTYVTTGSDGSIDLASGLLLLPDVIDRPLPVLVYQHGTTSGRSDVPSELQGGFQLAALFAGNGMIVLAPDYLGMGTSRGFHPYVHAQTEATAAVDFVKAIQIFLDEADIEWNNQLFATGYSQGGHGAMAFHKYVQEEKPDGYEITASLPMSGPYDVSGIMKDLAFRNEIFGFPAYIVYTTLGLKAVKPEFYEDVSQIFKAPYVDDVRAFNESGEDLFGFNEALIQILNQEHGQSVPRAMFKDSVLNVLIEDVDHPFNEGLRESDLYDWAPEAPVLMLYCPDDEQVPFTNSILADSIMNLNGAANVQSMDVSGGQVLDHTGCIVPALNVGIPWLLGFIDRTTPTIDVSFDEVLIYPNPASEIVQIEYKELISLIEIFDMNGRRLLSQATNSNFESINIQSLSSGPYLMHIYTKDTLSVEKLVVTR